MSIKLSSTGLEGPGDLTAQGGGRAANFAPTGSGTNAPTWEVGDPVAAAMAGLPQALERFAEVHDDIQINNFLLETRKELDTLYNDPENGIFKTRKGLSADGVYQEFSQWAEKNWEERARKTLNERQLGKAGKAFNALYMDMGRRVASHEMDERRNGYIESGHNAVFQAQEFIARGDLSQETLGASYASISGAVDSLAKLHGWDEETKQRKFQQYFGEAVLKGSAAMGNTDPTQAYGAVERFEELGYIPASEAAGAKAALVSKGREFLLQKAREINETQGPEAARKFVQENTARDTSGGHASGWVPISQSNNPGNVKTSKGNFARYETPADGLNAIAGRFIRYQESNDFGKAQTVRQALSIYAPKGDGKNDPNAYAKFVQQETGLDPDALINFRENPDALAKITRAVVIFENGKKATDSGNIYSRDQYAQGAADAIAGKEPKLAAQQGAAGGYQAGAYGLRPEDAEHVEKFIIASEADKKAASYVARLETGEDAHDIQKEILALPPKESGPVNTQFRAHYRVWQEKQKEKTQDGIIENRLEMQEMLVGDAFKFVEALPEKTWTERKIKQMARVDYGVMSTHAGLSRTTDPDAYSKLVDAITYGEVKNEKDLRSHKLASSISTPNMDKLVHDLKGASSIQEKDLQTAYRWAIGKDEDSPNGKSFNDKDKEDFLKFSAWAAEQAKNSNRAKEPGYVRELARQWKRQQWEVKSNVPFTGYGWDRPGGEAMNDPNALPIISEADSQRIENLFMQDQAGIEKWRKRFPQYADDPELLKRAYYREELAQLRWPLRRGASR
jgi:hypothetical protein